VVEGEVIYCLGRRKGRWWKGRLYTAWGDERAGGGRGGYLLPGETKGLVVEGEVIYCLGRRKGRWWKGRLYTILPGETKGPVVVVVVARMMC
jgi:hypothetical protein